MAKYAAIRLLAAVPTLIGITLGVFLLTRAVPGDPVAYYLSQLGPRAGGNQQIVTAIRAEHGLDQPVATQYIRWLGRAARLDLGVSTVDRRPVVQRVLEKLPATLLLGGVAFLIAALIAVPLGVMLAPHPRATEWSSIALIVLMSVPPFWAGLILADWLALRMRILPLFGTGSGFVDTLRHLVLPAACLTYGQLAFFTRITAATVREQLTTQHALAARARGASVTRVGWRYGLRPGASTLVSLLGVALPATLSGSIIIERLFAWDGIGRLYFDAVSSRDYPTVMGLTLVAAVSVLLINIVVDVLHQAVDPRVERHR